MGVVSIVKYFSFNWQLVRLFFFLTQEVVYWLHVVACLLCHHQTYIKIVQKINAFNYNTISLKTKHSIYVGYSKSKYRLRVSLAHPQDCHLRMCSDFLYQLRSHRRHFMKFMLCLCLFLCIKHV